MEIALLEAKLAMQSGEVPVGVVIVKSGNIIAKAGNLTIKNRNSTAHAEILAIQKAHLKVHSRFLIDCDLYTTLEPCTMCSGAISLARINRVYFGAYDPKSGAIYNGAKVFNNSACHHKPEIYGGIMEQECSDLLKEFFQQLRSNRSNSV